jgi:tetratricopeptide (TPR) repeat protein
MHIKHIIAACIAFMLASCGEQATVREEALELTTYPFSDPDPVPRTGNAFYPYFKFDGYAHQGEPQTWNTVVLENRHIRVTVVPSIGGKIWGAVEKSSGREFIYFNHAVKFRNISMRGPWTSGGVEFNFGIIGHAPTTASPVDYHTRRNGDGSVSCFVAAFDMVTGAWWQVEINLQPDKAFFTTSVTWRNTTPFLRPYYQWMNAAYRAADDLNFIFPGQYYIGHKGDVHSWPFDEKGRDLSRYATHAFGADKSMHVLGNCNDFYGAYYENDRFGSVHYSPFNDKSGMKIFLWGLSRSGMIWEDLLTDTDGQYVELQSGRLYNQAVTESNFTPFKQYAFEPYAVDTWTEYWYPVKETGGMVKAGDMGALNVTRSGDSLTLSFSPVQRIDDKLTVRAGEREVFHEHLSLDVMQTWRKTFALNGADGSLKVVLGDNRLVYSENPADNRLARPVTAPPDFDCNSAYGLSLLARQKMNENKYGEAENLLNRSLAIEPYAVGALWDLGLIHCRRGRYAEADSCARLILSVNAYDPDGNFLYGLANSRLGNSIDAVDGFKIAAFSPARRAAAYVCLAQETAKQQQWSQTLQYAGQSVAAGNSHGEARQLQALALRKTGKNGEAGRIIDLIERHEPLNHYARFEKYLLTKSEKDMRSFQEHIRCELPHETFMEMAGWYESMDCHDEALTLYALAEDYPVALYRSAFLLSRQGDGRHTELLQRAESLPVRMVFPFRTETVPALEWAVAHSDKWVNKYYLAVLYSFLGENEKATTLWEQCGDTPDDAVFYQARAQYRIGEDRLKDLLRAERLEKSWRTGLELVRHFQEEHRYDEMYGKAKEYFTDFPDNYVLGLKYAAAMLATKRYRECTGLLSSLNVLPDEGASEGRTVYRKAWLFCALDNIEKGNFSEALADLEQSKLWPENLGVGKPYDEDIDLSVENFITEYCNAKLNGAKPPRPPRFNTVQTDFNTAQTEALDDETVKEVIRICR